MSERYDVVIVGLGAMGAAAAYQLAKRGQRVLGLDRFHPPHTKGSSHGASRIIREAYIEDPAYVPLVQRAYELWAELEAESGTTLYTRTGGLMIGDPAGETVQGALASARQHGLDHELLDAAGVRERAPAFKLPDHHGAVWEPRAGVLNPERCVAAHLSLAAKYGAVLHFDEPVSKWRPDGDGVSVEAGRGSYLAGKLILSAGAWTGAFNAKLDLPLLVTRQTVYWFHPAQPETLRPERFPIYIWRLPEGDSVYGFADFGDGTKIGVHNTGIITEPDAVEGTVSLEEIDHARDMLRRYIPDAAGEFLRAEACLYTNTPDGHFLIDFHHRHPQVILASPCSGHGFKHSAAIGEVLADLVTQSASRLDLGLFGLDRLLTEKAT